MKSLVTYPFPTAKPALPASVYMPLTIFLITFYAFLFVIVYVQLVLIWYYKHKRFSYQTSFLFLSLFWSALRIVLFSFYFNNADDANKLTFAFYYSLYCFPVFLQYSTLCLLAMYYGKVISRSRFIGCGTFNLTLIFSLFHWFCTILI